MLHDIVSFSLKDILRLLAGLPASPDIEEEGANGMFFQGPPAARPPEIYIYIYIYIYILYLFLFLFIVTAQLQIFLH